jgi:hypothetical protein
MTRRTLFPLAVAAALVALPGIGHAQEPPRPEAAKEGVAERRGPQGVSLRVQLVISRFQGEKKLASLPYTFVVTTGGGRARMRMGVDTPIPVTSTSESGKQTTSIQYRNVGTNIDCAAWDKGDGRYQLSIGVENSSALPGATGSVEGAAPLFRRFETNLDPWLRDGQSVQTIASTDPVTGEVVKIDVTMNVVK